MAFSCSSCNVETKKKIIAAMFITSPCCSIIVCLVLVFCLECMPSYFVYTLIPGELDAVKAYMFSHVVVLNQPNLKHTRKNIKL